METYMQRLMEPELLFGLAVRFFGVFTVLIILMLVLYLSGWIFTRYKEKKEQQGSGGPSGTSGTTEKTPIRGAASGAPSMETTAPQASGEAAAAIALCVQESLADGSLVASKVPAEDEVAAAIALALSDSSTDQVFPQQRYGSPAPFLPQGNGHRESPWKLLGRQEAISRNNPWTGRRAPTGR
jgi:hypothetical protein